MLVAGSAAALKWDWFFRLDQTLYDRAIELIQRPPRDDIVIVGIDEEILVRTGDLENVDGLTAGVVKGLREYQRGSRIGAGY